MHYNKEHLFKEILSIIEKSIKKTLYKELEEYIKCSIQINGSVDIRQRDNKFVFIKINNTNTICCCGPFRGHRFKRSITLILYIN